MLHHRDPFSSMISKSLAQKDSNFKEKSTRGKENEVGLVQFIGL
jgi:hypothetical protein